MAKVFVRFFFGRGLLKGCLISGSSFYLISSDTEILNP